MDELALRIDELKEQIFRLERERDTKVTSYGSEYSLLEKRNSDMRDAIAAAEDRLSELGKESNTIDNVLETKKQRVSEEIAKKRSDLDAHSKQVTELLNRESGNLKRREQKVANLENDVRLKEAEYRRIASDLSKRESDANDLIDDATRQIQEAREYQAKLAQRESDLDTLFGNLSKLQDDLDKRDKRTQGIFNEAESALAEAKSKLSEAKKRDNRSRATFELLEKRDADITGREQVVDKQEKQLAKDKKLLADRQALLKRNIERAKRNGIVV